MDHLLLKALQCSNRNRPPVWLMRQAGRYLPQYRLLREKHSLWEMFHRPELAVSVTKMPVEILGVDAAILFSDILVIAEALGLKVQFPERGGPVVSPSIESEEQIDALSLLDVKETLPFVFETIQEVKKDLKVPLIGFCGAPFTVASYLIDCENHFALRKTKALLYKDPEAFHRLLNKIAEISISYLKLQIEEGVDVIQIFDSWANCLTYPSFFEFSLKYLRKILSALKCTKIPVILFSRGSSLYPKELSHLEPSAISFDWHKSLVDLRDMVPPHIAVQGNLDPDLLKAPFAVIRREVSHLIHSMDGDRGFIVNLGHGVVPDTPVEHVRYFVDTVRSFS